MKIIQVTMKKKKKLNKKLKTIFREVTNISRLIPQ